LRPLAEARLCKIEHFPLASMGPKAKEAQPTVHDTPTIVRADLARSRIISGSGALGSELL